MANPDPASKRSPTRFWIFLIISFLLFVIAIFSLHIIVDYVSPNQPVVIIDTIKSSTSLSTVTWNLTLKVTNENFPTKTYFDHLNVSIAYKTKLIAQTNTGPFVVSTLSRKLIHTNLSVTSAEDAGKYVLGEMLEHGKNGSLVVQIRVWYAMRFTMYKKWKFASQDYDFYNGTLWTK